MAALTEGRTTKSREFKTVSRQMLTNVKIFEGSMVVLTAAGYAKPAVTGLSLKSQGRARATVDNTGGASGAKTIEIDRGCFHYANSAAGDLITIADLEGTAYLVDDQTVAKTDGGGTRSAAGTIVDVDALGVWIKFA